MENKSQLKSHKSQASDLYLPLNDQRFAATASTSPLFSSRNFTNRVPGTN